MGFKRKLETKAKKLLQDKVTSDLRTLGGNSTGLDTRVKLRKFAEEVQAIVGRSPYVTLRDIIIIYSELYVNENKESSIDRLEEALYEKLERCQHCECKEK